MITNQIKMYLWIGVFLGLLGCTIKRIGITTCTWEVYQAGNLVKTLNKTYMNTDTKCKDYEIGTAFGILIKQTYTWEKHAN